MHNIETLILLEQQNISSKDTLNKAQNNIHGNIEKRFREKKTIVN